MGKARERADSLLGDVKPVSTLYEYWCYFTVRNILKDLYGPDITGGKNMVFQSAGKLSMRLTEYTEGAGAVFQENLPEGAALHLFFNRRFRPKKVEESWGQWSGTYSVSFDPDISIAVKTPAATHWLNFDAKYRLGAISVGGRRTGTPWRNHPSLGRRRTGKTTSTRCTVTGMQSWGRAEPMCCTPAKRSKLPSLFCGEGGDTSARISLSPLLGRSRCARVRRSSSRLKRISFAIA